MLSPMRTMIVSMHIFALYFSSVEMTVYRISLAGRAKQWLLTWDVACTHLCQLLDNRCRYCKFMTMHTMHQGHMLNQK